MLFLSKDTKWAAGKDPTISLKGQSYKNFMTHSSPNYSIEKKSNLMIQTVINSLENAEEKISPIS